MLKFLTGLFAWLGGLFAARPKSSAATGTAAVRIAAAAFVGPWEGERLEAYLDRIASPPVWTVCYGETKGVKQGDTYTAQQCLDMLSASLAGYHAQLAKCIPTLPLQPQGVQVALTSWTYNVGAGAACSSTLAKRANAGDWRGACDQLPRWDKAGGKVIRGLTNRRAAEQKLCLQSLKQGA
ncbi:lysozyme [Xinfangfangia sp. D13-10-4-6]|uniref:lysozyme n=1 Tax=Pseudogemmobacter hezensis TaxID=2737662 RepID=UPI001552B0B5|nr:lysozyme [Pseudogemmobacter hezensis]NPD15788.1 lysozyme [Pseudogemmobacter hezensis]